MKMNDYHQRSREALHVLADHHITQKNYQQYESLLRPHFLTDTEYQQFIEEYLLQTLYIHMDDFIDKAVNTDAFPVTSTQVDHAVSSDSLSITVVVRGTATLVVDGKTLQMQPHDLCLMQPYARLMVYQWSEEDFIINIAIRPNAISQVFRRCLQVSHPIQQFLQGSDGENSHSFMHLRPNDGDLLEAGATDIFQLCEQRRMTAETPVPFLDQMIDLKAESLLLSLLYYNNYQLLHSANMHSQLMTQILSLIQNHIADITLSTIASELGYTTSYVSRYIQQMTGKSYTELVQLFRMNQAANLLRESSLTVDEIMQETGYSGKANFYKVFEEHYRMTPAVYRKKARKNLFPQK